MITGEPRMSLNHGQRQQQHTEKRRESWHERPTGAKRGEVHDSFYICIFRFIVFRFKIIWRHHKLTHYVIHSMF